MIKICRLSIGYAHNADNERGMKDVFDTAMQEAGITMDQISLDGPTYSTKTHFGNWCVVPVLDNDKTERLAAIFNTKIDNRRSIIEEKDFSSFPVGKKVRINYTSDFGFDCTGEGKIIRNNGELTILKKGSRSKGWSFRPWDEVIIEVI